MFLFTSITVKAGVTNTQIKPLSTVSQHVRVCGVPRPYPCTRVTANVTMTTMAGKPNNVEVKKNR